MTFIIIILKICLIGKKYDIREDKYFFFHVWSKKGLEDNTSQTYEGITKSLILITQKIIKQLFVLDTKKLENTYIPISKSLITEKITTNQPNFFFFDLPRIDWIF